jgi:serine protease
MKKVIFAAVFAVMGCGVGTENQAVDESATTGQSMTYEQFKATKVWQDPETGDFIASGDERFVGDAELRELYDQSGQGQLIINRSGGRDTRIAAGQATNITYCISNAFGGNKQAVINALSSAGGAWAGAARVRYVYVPAQDASCSRNNNNVYFNVRQVSGTGFLASAFFPNNGRTSRELLIDTSSFSQGNLVGIMRHELGHTLGFRHEHTRPESGTCFEDRNWRALTTYDSASVMHYPQCNGTGSFNSLQLTARDRQGAAAIYGAP